MTFPILELDADQAPVKHCHTSTLVNAMSDLETLKEQLVTPAKGEKLPAEYFHLCMEFLDAGGMPRELVETVVSVAGVLPS
jgi:hypothetical protein